MGGIEQVVEIFKLRSRHTAEELAKRITQRAEVANSE